MDVVNLSTSEAVENAWRTHSAIVDWTGKVDTKAAFGLTFQAAGAAGVLTLAAPGRLFADLEGVSLLFFRLASAMLALGVGTAVLVVTPRLRSSSSKTDSAANWIYFGHLRHWEPAALEKRFIDGDILVALSRQLVVMSRIAWRKHRLLQLSVTFASFSALLLLAAALWR